MDSDISQNELEVLVQRAQQGSIEDFRELYARYSRPIYNFIWRLVGEPGEVEDLTQETFLKVYAELPNLREPSQFKFWLYRIARNEVYQVLRKSKRKSEVSIDDEDKAYKEFLPDESDGFNPERQLLSGELNEVINSALMALKPKYRDVFILAVFEKLSYEEISGIVGRSLLSVKTDIYRARLTVKEALNAYQRGKR